MRTSLTPCGTGKSTRHRRQLNALRGYCTQTRAHQIAHARTMLTCDGGSGSSVATCQLWPLSQLTSTRAMPAPLPLRDAHTLCTHYAHSYAPVRESAHVRHDTHGDAILLFARRCHHGIRLNACVNTHTRARARACTAALFNGHATADCTGSPCVRACVCMSTWTQTAHINILEWRVLSPSPACPTQQTARTPDTPTCSAHHNPHHLSPSPSPTYLVVLLLPVRVALVLGETHCREPPAHTHRHVITARTHDRAHRT
jgi:hypothetical protein